jgi:hypothetical protein
MERTKKITAEELARLTQRAAHEDQKRRLQQATEGAAKCAGAFHEALREFAAGGFSIMPLEPSDADIVMDRLRARETFYWLACSGVDGQAIWRRQAERLVAKDYAGSTRLDRAQMYNELDQTEYETDVLRWGPP